MLINNWFGKNSDCHKTLISSRAERSSSLEFAFDSAGDSSINTLGVA